MRIRTDGRFAYREDDIEAAADWWDCNKTEALLRSAEAIRYIEPAIQDVLERDDLTARQRREIAAALSVGQLEIEVKESVTIEMQE